MTVTSVQAPYWLVNAAQSLLHQSDVDAKRKQGDGWGIGWYAGKKPRILKRPQPMYRDIAPVRRAAREAAGQVLIGHVRWASNPLKLMKDALLGTRHTQPFSYREWLFAHNGTLLIPKEVRTALGSFGTHIEGNNDSEVLFYWILKHLPKGPRTAETIARGVEKSIAGLHRIWKDCRKKYPIYKDPYHGLNILLTNGRILIATCYASRAGFGKAKALQNRKTPYYQLHYKPDCDGWIVASEPLDHDPEWRALPHGSIITVEQGKLRHRPLRLGKG